jgi:hypothetical protein
VRSLAAAALAALFLVACGQGTTVGPASSSRTTGRPPSPSQASLAKLTCAGQVSAAHAMAVYRPLVTPPLVEILDTSNPLKPSVACTLSPAQGARFLSGTKVAFWVGDELGTADLISGVVTRKSRIPAVAGGGSFSADGTKFAYRAFDAAGGMSTHLYVAGSDKTLYVQEPLGGHGGPGPSFGPFDQLEFSPDGTLLLDFYSRPQSGPASFIVFKSDGSISFQSKMAANGTWSPRGNTLFFFLYGQPGLTGELDKLAPDGQRQVVASGLDGVYWPRMSPDGGSIVYSASDSSVPDCGGVPHLWRMDLTTRRASQLSKTISSAPVFVQPTVVWSDEQVLSQCGPGGPSAEDGVILAHDLSTGRDTKVDTTLMLPAISGSQRPDARTGNLVDAWFAPA